GTATPFRCLRSATAGRKEARRPYVQGDYSGGLSPARGPGAPRSAYRHVTAAAHGPIPTRRVEGKWTGPGRNHHSFGITVWIVKLRSRPVERRTCVTGMQGA